MRLLVSFSLLLFLLACSGGDSINTKNKVRPDTEEALSEAVADSFWALRADTAFANRAVQAYVELVEANPGSITLGSKLSKAFYYKAQYLTLKASQRDSLFMRGYEASQTVLNNNNAYRDLLFSTGEESMAIRGLDIQFIDALYWGMANYGQWLSTKGALVRLGQRDLHWTTLEHIYDLDSSYYYGAYYRYKGPLLARDPATQSDTLAIRLAFEKAIEIAPDYLGNYTLMARYYCPLIKDKDLFYRLLTTVITSSPNPALPYSPENLYEKELAERLMIKAEKEKWF